eukprot:TRINITY_DN19685_c0_g1_i1.p1 TRINITY_DN19685_c0_g1~~TRINITY_DN19685_c0_g1_i1.p1  ORF type:complete len:298 (-),score=62.78 TRINITY_DN19685_c0_g1_i1:37-930(-)
MLFKSIAFWIMNFLTWMFPAPLEVTDVDISIANLPYSLENLQIAQISDLHWDHPHNTPELLDEIIQTINSRDVDLIFLTGDYVNRAPEPIYDLCSRLSHLRAKVGIYAILGNHDYKTARSKRIIVGELEKIGVKVLINEAEMVLPDLEVIGVGDAWSPDYKPEVAFAKKDMQRIKICLSHNPSTAADLSKWETHLILSGHTHGGQMCFADGTPLTKYLRDFIPRSNRPRSEPRVDRHGSTVVRNWEWISGLYQVPTNNSSGSTHLYVNRGMGTHPPMRWNCNPELTFLHLKTKPEME